MKTFPKIGDKCYLRQYTDNYYVNKVKRPYTVIDVTPTRVKVQACELIYPVFHYDAETMSDYYKQFDGRRVSFYDTVAESAVPNPDGRIKELTWHPKRALWGTKESSPDCVEYMIVTEEYEHFPYLD